MSSKLVYLTTVTHIYIVSEGQPGRVKKEKVG